MTDVDLVAVVEPAPQQSGLVQGMPALLPSIDALIAEGVDLCVVATPTRLHEQIAVRLADAGVHALVEKPLAQDVSSATRIAEAFERSDVVGCVGHIERYNPALTQLRRRLAAGELGDVFQVSTRRQGPFPARVTDVGVVHDLATHDIDLTAWVTQQPYTEVSARTAHRSGRRDEDLVAAVGTLADGTVVNHLVNWLSPMKERTTVVTGEAGCLVADTVTADLTYHANGAAPVEWDTMAAFRGVVSGDMVRYAFAKPEPLVSELTDFLAAVRGEDSSVVSLREGVRVVGVAEALVRSAAHGQTVRLDA